ncbi:uncharacterized protein O3C94_023275 [Discoglossus pictus]
MFVPAPGYQPVYNPGLPYRSPIYGGLRPGMSVYIQGTIHHDVSRFVVNFACGQYEGSDIAFHINPRFDGKDKVVFNSFLGGSWGGEEKKKHDFPFHRGRHFEMVIFVNPNCFQVNVNGSPFYEFSHRVPVETVDNVFVDGDLTIQSLNIIGGGGGGLGGAPMPIPSYQGGVMPMPSYPSGNLPVMGMPMHNPPVPYYGNIMGGLSSKRTIAVKGYIPDGAEKFYLNFKVGSSNDIALHFNPRLTEDAVVRNSLIGGCWGAEERGLNFNPFRPGQYFDISIRCGNSRFKVYVNGEHFCDFAHRFQAFQMIDGLEVGGDVVLSYTKTDMAYVPAPGYQPMYQPQVPFKSPVYGGLRAGMSVYIQGSVNHGATRFSVNLACGQFDGSDIAFHFNPRFDGKDRVVFNNFQGGAWGREETKKDNFPFHKGRNFEIVIFANPGGFQVNVNGSPFYQFAHRIPLERVDCVDVKGDVTIQALNISGGGVGMGGVPMPIPSFPPGGGVMPLPSFPASTLPVMGGPSYNPPVPYFGSIMGGMSSKRTIVIRGFLPDRAARFHINFKVGSSNDIALHFNPRLNENCVVRNSNLRGSWGHEERGMSTNPFQRGQYFDISIRCGNSRFKIFVNGQHFCDYAHRFPSFQMIDGLEIGGDVQLSFVQI